MDKRYGSLSPGETMKPAPKPQQKREARKLKPCPFDGSDKLFLRWSDIIGRPEVAFRVQCAACKSLGPYGHTEKEAIASWNRRKP